MKIVVLTNKDSIFGKKILNAFKSEKIDVYGVVIIHQPISYTFNLFNIVRKKIGLYTAFYYGIRRIFFENTKYKYLFRGKRIDLKYENLANNIFHTNGTNTKKTNAVLKSLEPDFIILGQTGIVKKEIIQQAKSMVLNAHPGILPDYRGVDVHKWAIYNKDFDKIGCSVHKVNEGVDTGDILRIVHNKNSNFENIFELVDILHESCASAMVDTIKDILSNEDVPELRQDKKKGRQFFKIPLKLEREMMGRIEEYKKYLIASKISS